ncbi:MAG: HAMP domain-containing protein [Chloroflexi bacterium]|nr:HAMP domain-containing protein [Chloroflexota bacterium]
MSAEVTLGDTPLNTTETADKRQRPRPANGNEKLYRRFYPRLNTRITMPFLIAIVIVAGIGVFIVTQLVSGSIEERINKQLIESAQAASNSVTEIERQQLATLRLMVFTDGVAEAIDNGDIAELDALLQPIATNEQIDDVIVFNAEGESIFALRRIEDRLGIVYDTTLPQNIDSWEGVQRVLIVEADRLGDKYVDVVGEPPNVTFFISAPVIDAENNLLGGVSIGIRASTLVARVREQALSGVTLYGYDGRVLKTTVPLAEDESLALSPRHAAELVATSQEKSVIEEKEISGQPYQVLYAPFKMRDQQIGLIAVALQRSIVTKGIGNSRDQVAILFSGLFIFVALMGMVVTRTIVRPVRRLVDTTRAIREGDLSRRVQLYIPDELGELGTSFDHMTDQLVARNREISDLYLAQVEETSRRDAILGSIRDAVIVLDLRNKMLLRNGAAEDLIEDLRSDAKAYQMLNFLCHTPEQLSQPRTVELAGSFFSVLATSVVMPSGEALGHVIVFRDITALVEAERVKDEMILQLSHELRTPLTAALGNIGLIQMLELGALSEQGVGFIDNSVRSLHTLARMIDQVVDVSTILAKKFSVHFERFNLAFQINNLVAKHRADIDAHGLVVSVLIPSTDLWIEADQERISRVIEELLRNAYSYTLPGGWIEVAAEAKRGRAIISVADSGVGIVEDEQERVFERLYRGQSADAGPTDTRGLGLGLYISKQIVEAHGGKIGLDSIPEHGTIVTIELPLQQR